MLELAAVDFGGATVEAQGTADGTFADIVAEIRAANVNIAFQEAKATAVHAINRIQFGVSQIVEDIAIVHHHLRVFGTQGTAVFA